MTTSDYKKVFKQLGAKPTKMKKYIKHNAPKDRKIGVASKKCRRCGRNRGHINKYNLHLCRQCFREVATSIGFEQYS